MIARSLRWRVWPRIVGTLIALALAVVTLAPATWVLFTGFKDRADLAANPLGVPTTWHWSNISEAWEVGNFGTYFANSVIVAIPTVIAVVALSALAAYAFAILEPPRGIKVFFVIFLAGLTIPLVMIIIPLFYQARSLGILNSYLALILPQVAKTVPIGILILYSFMRDIPRDILEAGDVDGCSSFQRFMLLILPMSRPAILALVIFTFMWTWNQYLLPTFLIQTDAMRTLPVGLAHFQGQFITDVPLLSAGAVITALPVVIVYIAFQREFIRGITAGALD